MTKKAVPISLKIKTICLTKKLLWLEKKCFTKNLFQIVIKITDFYIHCFLYIFCHQNKTMKFCSFHKFLFYGLTFSSIHWMLKHLLFNNTSLYLLWLFFATTFLFTSFAFFYSLLPSTKNEFHNKFFTRNASGFIFHFAND